MFAGTKTWVVRFLVAVIVAVEWGGHVVAAESASAEVTTEDDHRAMMKQLGIESLRPGANPNDAAAPNAVNYDEAKANPWPTLPDPLVTKKGERVTNGEMWWKVRRPEIVEEFDRELYGRVPVNAPSVKWEVVSTTEEKVGDMPVVTKKLLGRVDNSAYPAIEVSIDLTLTTPAEAKGPVPVMIEFGWVFPPGFRRPNRPPPNGPTWQEQLLERGWGYAILIPTSIQADNGAGLTKGVIGLANKGQFRTPEDWGALRAWAWGASRALDYLESDPAVDAKRVGIEGLSRYGKAALVAMAYDPRFAVGFIGSSGEGGAKLHRRRFGELVENLTGAGGYHWMAGNFLKYGGPLTANDLPLDAHELIALCAPRPVFISYGAATGPGGLKGSGSTSAAASWRRWRRGPCIGCWERKTWERASSRRWRRRSSTASWRGGSTVAGIRRDRTGRRFWIGPIGTCTCQGSRRTRVASDATKWSSSFELTAAGLTEQE